MQNERRKLLMFKQLLEPNFFGLAPMYVRIILIVIALVLLYFCFDKVTEKDTFEICFLATVLRLVICFVYCLKPMQYLSWISLAIVAVMAVTLWYKNKKNVLVGMTSAYEIVLASEVTLFGLKWLGIMLLSQVVSLLQR